MPQETIVPVTLAAHELGLDPQYVRNAVIRRERAGVQRAGRWFITREALAAWLRERAADLAAAKEG